MVLRLHVPRMHRRPSVLLTCLVLCALAWAQAFGISRGYLCDCGGEIQVTLSESCHGPHGAACHDQDEGEVTGHHHDEESEDDDTHHHTPFKEDVLAKQLSTPVFVFVAPVSWLPLWELPLLHAAAQMDRKTAPSWAVGDGTTARRWPRVLARTIALQV